MNPIVRGLPSKLARMVQPQDLAWLLLFAALAWASPSLSSAEIELLSGLALMQVLEPRVRFFQTNRGKIISVTFKLVLGYLLVGVSGGLQSSYYPIMMVPVVAAATTFGALGTTLVTLVACLSYLSFFAFLDWSRYFLLSEDLRELGLRVLFLGMLGFLTHRLVDANRTQARRYQSVAEQLSEANRSLRAAEAAVRRSERLAALGQLMAGLAHELRNPLGTMRASAEVLVQKVSAENEVARELAGYIQAEVDRTSRLITRFLDFARPLRIQPKLTELGEVIDRAITQLERHKPPFDVSVYRNYSPDIRPIPLDGELMERVAYNLLENAAQATPPGGAITVKIRPVNGVVEMAVIDRGGGIEEAHRESIFNPFFSTKPNGVGLGLAIVARIVDEHGGKIAVESTPGQGSVFRVLLPTESPR